MTFFFSILFNGVKKMLQHHLHCKTVAMNFTVVYTVQAIFSKVLYTVRFTIKYYYGKKGVFRLFSNFLRCHHV